MNPPLDRFQPPTAADDVANCQNCGEAFHNEALSEQGLCNQCQPEDNDRISEKGN